MKFLTEGSPLERDCYPVSATVLTPTTPLIVIAQMLRCCVFAQQVYYAQPLENTNRAFRVLRMMH